MIDKLREDGKIKLNEVGVARANRLVEYSNETPAIWGKSKFTMADRDAYAADIKKQIEEAQAAGEDTWSITMRDDGESRLPPTSTNIQIFPGRVYQVLRARAVGYWNYHKHSGQCLVLDPVSGREVYVPRDYVEAV